MKLIHHFIALASFPGSPPARRRLTTHSDKTTGVRNLLGPTHTPGLEAELIHLTGTIQSLSTSQKTHILPLSLQHRLEGVQSL